jgi:hypothetical protein
MSCSIINRSTQTVFGQNSAICVKGTYGGSALQNPDLSGMTLKALMRKELRLPKGTSHSFWSQFLNRNVVANVNNV